MAKFVHVDAKAVATGVRHDEELVELDDQWPEEQRLLDEAAEQVRMRRDAEYAEQRRNPERGGL
jgi:hypothetical protein